MKRTSLTTAVIAGIAGVAGISNMASAVYLNTDGLGQVLIYPYYTVNAGNITLLSVVNTTAQGKALKVRFLEAYNSREVLDFNVYLSPHDVWVSAVVPSGAGAGVFSIDNSCTVPKLARTSGQIAGGAGQFVNYAYAGGAADGGPTGLSRTLEGYVELIEMGTVVNADNGTLDAITHSNGVPANCNQVIKAWNGGGYWAQSFGVKDIAPPTGGLFGSGTILNVNQGTVAAYNADAIDQFYASNSPGNHTTPLSISPNLGNGTSNTSYVFAPSPSNSTPSLVTTTYTKPINAVSSLFMADAIYNEYWSGGGLGGTSEWVVTFPTKRFYVDSALPSTVQGGGAGTLPPFDVAFRGTSCSPIGLLYYDREENQPIAEVGFSPPPPTGSNNLCYESQVVTFNQSSASSGVLGSNLVSNISTGYTYGWAMIDFYNAPPPATAGTHILPASYTANSQNVFRGLPVTGFWVANIVNSNVSNGVLANYSALYRHKAHRTCAQGTGTSACS